MEKISIIIADDHPMFRAGVKQSLEIDKNLTIIGEASNGKEALDLILEKKPDVAILDINMPHLTGLQVVKELNDKKSSTEIVLLTMFDDEDILNEAMDLDVKAYILKESAVLDIVNAIHSASEKQIFISSSLTGKLNKRNKDENLSDNFKNLSEKEIVVLKLISEYKTTKEIAEELFLSPKTVENYRYRISEKLKLSGSYSLIKFALSNKEKL